MNLRTNPMRARASANAMPRNMVVRTVPSISGCRAIAWMALPTIRPMPTPGPMAARPYPTEPSALLRSPVTPEPLAAATTWITLPMSSFFLPGAPTERSVLEMDGLGDVHRGQNREDVGLEHRHQHLERGERDETDERQRREHGLVDAAVVNDQQLVDHDREDREQHVPRGHVREESDRQREGAHQEDREELDRDDEELQRHRNARRVDRLPDVALPLVLEADDDEDQPRDQRQEQRDREARRRREVDDRDDRPDVDEEDPEEERREVRRPLLGLLGADRLQADVLFDELVAGLREVLESGRHERLLPGAQAEDEDADGRRDERHERRLVEREDRVRAEDVAPVEDLVEAREELRDHVFTCLFRSALR